MAGKSTGTGFKKTKSSPFTQRSTGGASKLTSRGKPRKGNYKGGRRERADLKWGIDEYGVSKLNKRSEREVRAEYSRIRSILRKRVERMRGSEWEASHTYLKYGDGIKSLKDIKDRRELSHRLNELASELNRQTSSVKGLEQRRDNFIKTMNDRYPAIKINASNYIDFMDFMQTLKDYNAALEYDSEQMLEFFDSLQEKQREIDFSTINVEFQKFLREKDAPRMKWVNAEPVSSSQVVKKWKRR